jgi:Brix domain
MVLIPGSVTGAGFSLDILLFKTLFNLTFLFQGRTFDGHILDMVEFGVDNHQSIDSFSGQKKAVGSKPLMIFLGDQWDSDSSYFRIMNLLLDFFRADRIEKISLKGMDHVLVCSVMDGKIHIRGYTLGYRKSGTKVRCFECVVLFQLSAARASRVIIKLENNCWYWHLLRSTIVCSSIVSMLLFSAGIHF